MSESPDDENKDSKNNSDLSDIVQWSGNSKINTPVIPIELNDENILEIPPPPAADLIPPPPPAADLIPPPPPAADLIPPPPELESVEIPDLEIPPPPSLDSEAIDLLDSLPPPPLPDIDSNNSLPFAIPGGLSESMEEIIEVAEVDDSDDYKELWKRTSDKPLQQVYGHIDRLGTGEVGSLLDRYADRFGSELDREIIVLRQQERQQKIQEMQQVPIVELIEEEEESDESTEEIEEDELSEDVVNELEDELDIIEEEIAEIEPLYNAAKKKKRKKADVKRYGDELNALFERRDAINAVLDGEEDYETLEQTEIAKTVEEDLFEKFVGVVDDLLGKLPEDELNSFLTSGDFDLYKTIASNPDSASDDDRKSFFKLVNEKLAKLPENVIEDFIASENWSLYEEMGELYN